jgi:hypothetical protein
LIVFQVYFLTFLIIARFSLVFVSFCVFFYTFLLPLSLALESAKVCAVFRAAGTRKSVEKLISPFAAETTSCRVI